MKDNHNNMFQNAMECLKTTWKYCYDLHQPWKAVIAFVLWTCATVVLESLGSRICLGVVVWILLATILVANKQKIPALILLLKKVPLVFLLVVCMLVYELFVGVAFTNSKCLQSSSIQTECTCQTNIVFL